MADETFGDLIERGIRHILTQQDGRGAFVGGNGMMYGHGITGDVIRNKRSLVVPDVRLDARYVQGRAATLSEITVPVILNDRAIGALNLESDRLKAYTQDDIAVGSARTTAP